MRFNKTRKIIKNLEKRETKFLKNLDRCKTRKCSKNIKTRNTERNIFTKHQNIKCQQKSPKAFYDCSDKFYEGSKLQKLSEKVQSCSLKKCHKEKMKLKKIRNEVDKIYEKMSLESTTQ